MIFNTILILAATVATSSVPSQFQGDWRVSLAECPPANTDRPIRIDASKIRLDHSVGDIRVIEDGGSRDVTVAGDLLSDGDPWNAKLRLELSKSERELKISEGEWSVKLLRCPEGKTSK